jgi:hypothetical protein
MSSAVYFAALLLQPHIDKISPGEFNQIISAKSREQMAQIAGRLYEGRYISAEERDNLISCMVQDLLTGRSAEAQEKARVEKVRAMMQRDEYYSASRKGSPAVQGGLPSLGKCRP